jgi:hypothetical protein
MGTVDGPKPQGNYQASSLVVSPRPNEFGFAMREDEFQILCDGAVGDARASRDLFFGFLVGAAVGLIGVFATIDWDTIWQPNKRGSFLFWVAILLLGIVSSGTAGIIFHLRLKKTRADSAYARLTRKIQAWFIDQQGTNQSNRLGGLLTIRSAQYGAGALWADVTDRLCERIRDGALRVSIKNEELGSDPAPNVPKSLKVEYIYSGKSFSRTVPENQILSIPEA